MEKAIQTPIKLAENKSDLENKTPSTNDQYVQESCNDLRKSSCTPDRLKVPKAFKYPERYRSPTDAMMSPISKGLLARNRKAAALLPPSLHTTQIQELSVQDKADKDRMPLNLLEIQIDSSN